MQRSDSKANMNLYFLAKYCIHVCPYENKKKICWRIIKPHFRSLNLNQTIISSNIESAFYHCDQTIAWFHRLGDLYFLIPSCISNVFIKKKIRWFLDVKMTWRQTLSDDAHLDFSKTNLTSMYVGIIMEVCWHLLCIRFSMLEMQLKVGNWGGSIVLQPHISHSELA